MSGAGERTEAATPRKLQTLRSEGRVIKSTDLNAAVGVLAGLLVVQQYGGSAFEQIRAFAEQRFAGLAVLTPAAGRPDMTDAALGELGLSVLWLLLGVLAPFLVALPLVGVVVSVVQVGFLLNGKGVTPDLSRLNPIQGFSRLISIRSAVELAKSLVKVGVVAFVLYRTYIESLPLFFNLAGVDLRAAVPLVADTAFQLGMTVAVMFLALAAVDYGYQRWDYHREARMSKEEIKEEMKQAEGSPEIRAAIRKRQRQMAQSRMMQNVPKADVVITNPTHFAVALSYKAGEMAAPKVVAKGADLVAKRIKQIALENNVPVMENKPLARALFAAADVDDEVPIELFQAVAEVLAYIYALRRRKRMSSSARRGAN